MTGPAALADLVAAVRPGVVDDDPTAVLAAGAWSTLVEPGDRVAGALVDVLGPAEALDALRLDAPPSTNPELRRAFDRWSPRFDEASFVRAFRDAARIGARLLVPGDADWPRGLLDLAEHGPLALWALAPTGPVPSVDRSVALVGSRTATPYGERVTADAACGLADRGFTVVSGAAIGIDGVAHRAALASRGRTVAVLAGGLDRFYPAQHTELLHRIAVEGVVLSEMPCGARPMRERFLKRKVKLRGKQVLRRGGRRPCRCTQLTRTSANLGPVKKIFAFPTAAVLIALLFLVWCWFAAFKVPIGGDVFGGVALAIATFWGVTLKDVRVRDMLGAGIVVWGACWPLLGTPAAGTADPGAAFLGTYIARAIGQDQAGAEELTQAQFAFGGLVGSVLFAAVLLVGSTQVAQRLYRKAEAVLARMPRRWVLMRVTALIVLYAVGWFVAQLLQR